MNQFSECNEFLLDEIDNLNEMDDILIDILPENQLEINNVMNLQYELFDSQTQQSNNVGLNDNGFSGNRDFNIEE
ncbi:23885_t:CDS:1, partial [Dentiscutata erythropus]